MKFFALWVKSVKILKLHGLNSKPLLPSLISDAGMHVRRQLKSKSSLSTFPFPTFDLKVHFSLPGPQIQLRLELSSTNFDSSIISFNTKCHWTFNSNIGKTIFHFRFQVSTRRFDPIPRFSTIDLNISHSKSKPSFPSSQKHVPTDNLQTWLSILISISFKFDSKVQLPIPQPFELSPIQSKLRLLISIWIQLQLRIHFRL